MNKMGFELSINGKKYLVKCDTSIIANTSERDTSNKVNLRIRVFEDGEFIKLDRDGYVAEKITDFIRNCINGQDNVYWDWDEPNRHLDKPKKYLKWEDLPFEDNVTVAQFINFKELRCTLLCTRVNDKEEVKLRHYTDAAVKDFIIFLDGSDSYAKQFFNDLHLERVE